jgi:hypothetical protein
MKNAIRTVVVAALVLTVPALAGFARTEKPKVKSKTEKQAKHKNKEHQKAEMHKVKHDHKDKA